MRVSFKKYMSSEQVMLKYLWKITITAMCVIALFLLMKPMVSVCGASLTGFELAEANVWGMTFLLSPIMILAVIFGRLSNRCMTCLLLAISLLSTTATCSVCDAFSPNGVRLPALTWYISLVIGALVYSYLWLNMFSGGRFNE